MFTLLYHPQAKQEAAALPEPLKGKMARLLNQRAHRGNGLRFPLTRPLREGLFELRSSGEDIGRTLFVFQRDRKIWILRCYIKKTEKTPRQELLLALKRLEEMTWLK